MFRKNRGAPADPMMVDPVLQQIYYQVEELTRKTRNLNNRLRRIENYLGLRNDDKYDVDEFLDN